MSANHAAHYDEPCTLCQGRGVIAQDDVYPCPSCGTKNRIPAGAKANCGKCHGPMTGALPVMVTCPYCQGNKTSGWALLNQHDDAHRTSWARQWPWKIWEYIPMVFIVRKLWGLYARTPGHQARRLFTSPEEANTTSLAGGALAAGLIFKNSLNQHHRHQAQAAQQPLGSYYNQAPGTWSPYAPGSPQPGPSWAPQGPQGPQPGSWSGYAPGSPQTVRAPHSNAHQVQADQWNYQFNPSHRYDPPRPSHTNPHNPYADEWNDRYNPSHRHPGK